MTEWRWNSAMLKAFVLLDWLSTVPAAAFAKAALTGSARDSSSARVSGVAVQSIIHARLFKVAVALDW